jgi:putative hydrolase of the HAD superfamily
VRQDGAKTMGPLPGDSSPMPESEAFLKTLLVDADDTLWENNIYFETVTERYFSLMEDLGFSSETVRISLNEVERKNIRAHGYGTANFVNALKETLSRLAGPSIADNYLRWIDDAATIILDHPVELISGVAECLEILSQRHRTILFTKGNVREQERKIEASGLSRFFSAIEIAREKDRQSFLELLYRHQLVKERTWMIGNSPKSDINPAIGVGMNAVYIPHPRTWDLETEAFEFPEKVVILRSFSDLISAFD